MAARLSGGQMFRRSAAAITAGATGVAAAAAAYQYRYDDGTQRAVALYGYIGPVVVHYRLVEFKHAHMRMTDTEKTAEWRALDRKYASKVVNILESLQGMYTKYGQIASGMTNTFSPTWIEELRKLEDRVPPRPKEVVMQTILEETGRPASETFAYFEDAPLGSASIGQVHRATLRSDGSQVAVKVQYPEARKLFRTDMQTIKSFFTLAAPEQLFTLGELERQFELEFDYRQEAANLLEVGANMRKHGFSPREVVVPRPYPELTTERMLVMELLPGRKLLDGLREYGKVLAEKEGLSLEEWEEAMRIRIEEQGIPARYDGPSAQRIELIRRLLFLRDAALNLFLFVWNATVGGVLGARCGYARSSLPPNAPQLMDTLMRVHGTQLLVDGVFNADTHAGNFLLMPDDRVALIDYGATKRLSTQERLSACYLYAALRRHDEEALLQLAVSGGYRSRYFRRDVITKLTRFGFDTMGKDLLGDRNAAQFVDHLKAEDPYEEVADNLVLASFMSIRMRIVGMALNHPVVCSDWWGDIAEKELRDAGVPYEDWTPELMAQMNDGVVRVVKNG